MHSLLMGCFKTVEWIKLVQSLVLDCSHVSWASLWRKWVSCWSCCLEAQKNLPSAIKGRNRFLHLLTLDGILKNSSLCLKGAQLHPTCMWILLDQLYVFPLVLGRCSALMTSPYDFSSVPISVIDWCHLPPNHPEHSSVNSDHCRCTWT